MRKELVQKKCNHSCTAASKFSRFIHFKDCAFSPSGCLEPRVIGPFAKRAPGRLFTFGALREDAYSGQGAYFFFEKQPKILKFISKRTILETVTD